MSVQALFLLYFHDFVVDELAAPVFLSHIGGEPQDFHYTGEASRLIIGDNNDIRENVVISRATHESGCTRIGDSNYLMDGVHLCHDVQVGNHCVLGIKSTVAGDCHIDDCTILSSNVILHQNCHIGSWVLIQAGCRISKDVPQKIAHVSADCSRKHHTQIHDRKCPCEAFAGLHPSCR